MRRGRPKFQPTPDQRKQVDAMAGYGVPEEAIAKVLGIHYETLRKHFAHELDTAHIRANSAVAQSLFQKAMGNGPQSVAACIFWLKTRARWRETDVGEVQVYLGKKELALEAARTAAVDTDWAEDLKVVSPDRPRPN